MVEVNDKVFVAPLYGQPDNTAVITGPAGAGAVLNEGNYNTWTLEWYKIMSDPTLPPDLPDGLHYGRYDFFIDDRNNTIHITWEDASNNYRYGLFSCADFSNLSITPGTKSKYDPLSYGSFYNKQSFHLGECVYFGFAHSIQTYVLFSARNTPSDSTPTHLNVFQNTSSVWNRCVRDDFSASPQNTKAEIDSIAISVTGKYIIAIIFYYVSGYYYNIMLYKGSYVE